VKSGTAYKDVTRDELLMAPLRALVARYDLGAQPLGDVALGALLNSSSNWGIARESVLKAGIHPYTPAYFVQRACGTSLEAAGQIALKIASGQIEDGIAGGVDTNSDVPIEVSESLRALLLEASTKRSTGEKLATFMKFRPSFLKPKLPAVREPQTGLSMGEHCELMVKEWKIPREAQDLLALASHQNAVKALERGFFKDLVEPFGGLNKDGFPRGDTSLEKLAKLKPAFDRSPSGTITAGNSSPLTDGAAAVLLASGEQIRARGWRAQAKFVDAQSAAVDFVHGDGLLMAPTVAVGKLLARHGLKLQDFDFYEIHEAFAGQVECTLKAWESEDYCQKFLGSKALGSIDRSKLNVVGSSIAVGHPFAATGARVVATLAKLLEGTRGKRGLISVCTAGGMGVAAIMESVD
jgi:acetyl-CoA C-acetyltransferase